jgi:LCP family protein required for cell wall assembly
MPTPEQYLASLEDSPSAGGRPPRNTRKIIKRVAIVLVLLAAATGAYIFLNLLRFSANPFDFGKLRGEGEGRINILLLGVGDPGHAGEKLSDTNMVVSINTRDNQIAMISLPRDLRVRIPGHGSNKINQAHAYGGIPLAQEVVEATLDIPIHYYARANFSGLREAVDAVGGIEIDVKESLYDPEYPCDKNPSRNCGMRIKKGLQAMDGATALRYARCRKGNCGDDFGRALRQQEVLQAVRKKAMSASTLINPSKLNQLASALGDNIKTDLSINNLVRLGNMAKDIPQDRTINVVFSNQPTGFLTGTSGGSDLVPIGGTFEEIQKFVAEVFKLGPIWTEQPKLAIENGTTTSGLGQQLKAQIVDSGYAIQVVSLANALTRDFATSQIVDYTGGKKPNTIRYLEELLGVKATAPEKPVRFPASDIKVILGSNYTPATPTKTLQ